MKVQGGKQLLLGLLMGIGVGCAETDRAEEFSVTASPTLPSGLSITPLGRGTGDGPAFGKWKSPTDPTYEAEFRVTADFDVAMASVIFQPGGHSGWHTHPGGPVFYIVKSGQITEYDAEDPDCEPHTLFAGQSSFEVRSNTHHHLNVNEGTVPTELLVTYIVPVGANPLRVDMPQPSNPNCPVP